MAPGERPGSGDRGPHSKNIGLVAASALRVPGATYLAIYRRLLDGWRPLDVVRGAEIAVASLYVKAVKGVFLTWFVQIVRIRESITYAESEA